MGTHGWVPPYSSPGAATTTGGNPLLKMGNLGLNLEDGETGDWILAQLWFSPEI